jgi:hypothetical protein
MGFFIVSMLLIKEHLKGQIPSYDEIVKIGGDHTYKAKLFNITMQTIKTDFNNNPIGISLTNSLAHKLAPILISLLGLLVTIIFINKRKKRLNQSD